jgi:hypothetical protein
MANNKQLSSSKKTWNKLVVHKAGPVEELLSWVEKQESLKSLTWYDHVRATRARCYLQLALVEIHSMEYASPNEFRGTLWDEFNWAKPASRTNHK